MTNKIYSDYAWEKEDLEKGKQNRKTYEELKSLYNIAESYNYDKMSDEEKEKVDIVFSIDQNGYASTVYYIEKNRPNLTNLELALICDKGNLCFGFSAGIDTIKIYTD